MKTSKKVFIALVCIALVSGSFLGCKSDDPTPVKNTNSYPADVATTWIDVQLKLTRTGSGNALTFARYFAYNGVALYESVVPGMPEYKTLAGQLNAMPAMPTLTANTNYNWALSANAALAAMNRSFFPSTSAANKTTVDSLENVLNERFKVGSSTEEFDRSVAFGKQVAERIFEWSKSDGYDNTTPYTIPTGPGLWIPTPPANANPVLPNWRNNRTFTAISSDGAMPNAPTAYAEGPTTPFYALAKEVYDVSLALTAEQRNIVLFWADNPDGRSFVSGHWFSILNQVLRNENSTLDVAAHAFARLGMSHSDALVTCWKAKYQYNLVRPITYIRNVMGYTTWNSVINAPAHPEYPSGHSSSSAASAQALTDIFGANYQFTDNSYNRLGFSPRSYSSFEAAANEAALSRLYAGIHYRPSNEAGLALGKKVAQNIGQLKFKK